MARNDSEKLADLRKQLAQHGVAGFLIPSADEYQGEYVPAAARRLEWLTGFTGSNGIAAVLKDKAAFFTDGRYTLQAKSQVPATYERYNLAEKNPAQWLPKNASIGYDPKLFTIAQARRYALAGINLKPVPNLIDAIWKKRPPYPKDPAYSFPEKYAGESSAAKIKRVAKTFADKADALLVAAPDAVCWLLNIRGNDVPHTPFLNAEALVTKSGKVFVFADKKKLPKGIAAATPAVLKAYKGKRVMLDAAEASSWWEKNLKEAGAKIIEGTNPITTMKAEKNAVEANGIRNAHVKDGAALCQFLAWLSENWSKNQTEVTVADKLASFRKQQPLFKDLSFATIAGMNANGAIVHYHATKSTAKKLTQGIFLLDSGGQYLDGTTDVTRTIALGAPTAAQKQDFTRVLKGHIAIARARFPKGVSGAELDALARMPLWLHGKDYDHGTGHGVGHFLSVHEGPQRISRAAHGIALKPGMVVSNEPGYYKAGAYGIRIENLVLVVEDKRKGDEKPFLAFETLTLAPIDRTLIAKNLLDADERAWLNAYHARVLKTISPKVDAKTKTWLKKMCAPV